MDTIDKFCEKRGFLFHSHGSGKWGAFPYWTFYKVENNDKTIYSIEYVPISNFIKISCGCGEFAGHLDSEEHLLEMLKVLKIDVESICDETKIKENEALKQAYMKKVEETGESTDGLTLSGLFSLR